MALKFRFKSNDEVPPKQQALYVEREGTAELSNFGQCGIIETDEEFDRLASLGGS